nr:YadA-like family protein [Burkholderia sp. BCC0419]
MNKSYRTVWNATTGTWAAAPETARMRTKSKSNTAMRSSVTAAVAVMAGVGGGTVSVDAMAQATGGGLNLCSTTTAANGVRYGQTFGALSNTVSANCGPINTGLPTYQGHAPSFVLGNNANTNGAAGSTPTASVMGSTDGHLVLYGQNGVHVSGPADFNNNVNMTNHRITGLAAGTAGTDAVNLNQLNSAIANAATASNPYVAISTGASAAATAARAGNSATAVGANANAAGVAAAAFGGNTVASGDGAAAFGTGASAVGANAVALGRSTSTSGTFGTAIGYGANATTNAAAIGVLANAASASSVALGERASATGATSTALGRGTQATGANAVALGANSVADRNNSVSVGSASLQRQITNLAAGTANTDAVNLGQMNTALSTKVDNTYFKVNSTAAGSVVTSANSIAIGPGASATPAGSVGSNSIAIGNGAAAGGTDSIMIGTNARHSGSGATVVGGNASAMGGGAGTAFGANSSAAGYSSMALGAGTLASGRNSVALGTGSIADAEDTVSVGSTAVQRRIVNLAAGTGATDAVNVSQLTGVTKALGGGAAVGADGGITNPTYNVGGTDYHNVGDALDALASSGIGNPNAVIYDDATKSTVTLGGTGAAAPVALKNVADAKDDHDALNLGQLKDTGLVGDDGAGNLTSLAVTYDGATKDSVTLGGAGATTPVAIHNVADGVLAADSKDAVNGSQLFATNTRVGDLEDSLAKGGVIDPVTGESLAVVYDSNAKDTVTLAGTGGTTLSNVKAGVADMDAVNVSQLKGSGLIGDDGKAIAAVTYDRNADGTPNYGTVTLGNGAGPTQLKNVADATDDHDALNLGQLKDTGLVGDDGSGNLTSMAVTYDGAARDKVTLAGVDGTTLSNVKAGVADMDAVNVSQLKGSGLIGDDGKSIAAVTYDRNADGTPNYGSVTLGNGAGPTQVKNVADATDDHDALNLGQLKDAGLVGDDGAGNLTSMAVTYDGTARDKVTLAGVDGTTLSNVKAGVADMDAVNVSQLKGSGLIGDDGKAIAAVTYDRNADGTPNYGTVTLGNGAGPTQLKNVADATDDHDALNLGQLKDTGLVGDDGSGNLTSLAVTYDGAAKDSVTLGGAGATAPVAIHNVADGVLAADSKDAVNGSQLFATNTRVGDLEDSLAKGGVIDPVTGESLAVVYDSNAKDTVTLKGTDGTTLSNVKAGVADMDAVNVSQLKGSGLIGDDGKSIAAVTYDRNTDGTANYGTVTLGNGAGPTQIKNVATGVDDADAVNVKQLNTGLSDLEDRIVGADLRFVKVNADPVAGTPALATGALAVAIGAGAQGAGANSLALGSGARVSGAGSVAIGYNSVANQNNVVSVGSVGNERRIVNVADGDVAFQSTDAVNGGQLYAALNDLSTSVSSKTQQAIDSFSSALDEKTKAAINEMNTHAIQPMDVTDPLVAVEGVRGDNLASLNGADPATATAAAIGSSTAASGANAVAVGLQNVAGSDNSVAIGSFAQTGAGQAYSVAMGSNVQTNGTQAVAMGANTEANADYAVAIGNNGAQAIGTGSVALGSGANVRAGSTNAIAVGTGANVARSIQGAIALGAGTTATAAGGIALGENALANRANALSIGRAGAERQIVNVAAGTQATDAVNVSQLTGVTNALGGGAAVGANGSITNPTYSVGGNDYHNVGDALDALAASGIGDPNAVTYDDATKGAVTLGGTGATAPVALKNVADAKDDHDALNLGQLKDAGLVGDNGSGNLTSLAVTYDDAAKDSVTLGGAGATTPVALHNVADGVLSATSKDAVNGSQLFTTNQNLGDLKDSLEKGGVIDPTTGESLAVVYDGAAKDTVTLGGAGATTPVALKNVADAKDDGDALNLGQLKNAGLVGDDGSGNLTSMAVTYDGTARDKVTLAGVDGTTLSNVKAGVADMDAVNVSQLKDAGLIDPSTGKPIAAVTYDRNADGTPNYGSVTLGNGTGPTQLKNVADATDDGDALNLGQLKDAGLVGDDGAGNLTSMAVTYDGAAKDSVTLGGAGATTPVALHNVADGVLAADSKDAVNGSQLFTTNQNLGDLKDSLEKGGVIDPTTGESLAVVYDNATKNSVTLGNAGVPVAIHNVAAGAVNATSNDAVNGSQLFTVSKSVADKIGGGAGVGADGSLTDPTYSVGGQDYHSVGDALGALDKNSAGNPLAVAYDSAAKDTVTLGGAGATTPVALKNVADAKDDGDALNLGQLKNAGLVGDDGAGNLTSMAVTYDGAVRDTVTLAGVDGTTLTNVKAGAVTATSMDAINGAQLHGTAQSVADSLGGGSTVGADGKVTNPTYSLADPTDASKSKDYSNVGDALSNLDGRTVTNTENITVISKQLGDSGLVDPVTGQSIAAVTYDRNADGTPNLGSVTLGGAGATAPVALKNVADGADRHDAINLGQLQDAGLVAPVDPTNPGAGLTSLAVAYDDVAKDVVTLKGADGTTLSNVKAGVADMDAVNVSQLKDSGLIGDDGKAISAVTYDSAAKDAVTLGGAGATTPVALKNVADAKDDGDALNLGQLKNAGLVGDDGAGNLTSMAVTYDGAARDKVTLAGVDGTTLSNLKAGVADMDAVNVSQLKGSGLIGDDGKAIAAVTYDRLADGTPNYGSVTLGNGTGPTQLKNVADATDNGDALNLGQLKNAGLVGDDGAGNLTSMAVTYDGAARDTVTLAGTNGTTLANVKAGVADMDAVNVSQLKGSGLIGDDGKAIAAVTYDRNADGTPNMGSVTLGGAGATAPVALKNVADGTDRHDAINLGQLQDAGLVAPVDPTNPGAGLTSTAVTYDKAADGSANFDQITLKGADGTTLTNVKAGAVTATSTDAINGAQLHGMAQSVADSLGGGSTVGADGKVTNPTYSLADPTDASKSKEYSNVGDALSNLDGRTSTNTENITVISKQLGDSGLVDPVTGQSIAAVTYDRNADGTPNRGSVTLGGAGATTPVALKNVADGTDRNDAINLGQLQDAGLVAPVDPTNPGKGLTSLAVAYDSATQDVVTLKGTDGTTLTNVKAGAVTATSTDAINGAQLHGTAQSVADSLGGGSTVGADGKVTNPTYSLADPADASKSVAYNNVGDALSNLDGRTTTNTENITVISKQLGDSGLVDPVTGQSIAAVTYDRNADGTPNRGSVTLGGAGATAPVALKNVADGTDRHDAINLGQLQDAGLVAPVDPTNPGAGLASLAVTYGKNADGSANFDKVTLAGANGTTITNVKAGAVSATSTDAINGSQLHGVSQSVAKSLGGGAAVDADGNVTNPSYKVSDKTFDNVGDAIENISNSLVHGSIGLVQQDDTTRDITVAKDTDGTTVNFAGTAGNRVLTGVAAGAVNATSVDAINGSQLHGTAQSVADVIGGGTTVDTDGKLADTSIEVNGSKYKTVAEAVQAAAAYGATDSLAVRYDLNGDGTPNYGSVTLGGTGAAPVRLTNVADGASQYDAVNFGQLSELSDRIGGLDGRVGALEQQPPGSGGPGDGGSGNEYFAGTDVGTGSTTPANAGSGTGNTAAGSGATIGTGANNATVIGSNAGASQSNGVAIGSGAKSAAEGATAIGSGSNASGNQSVAIGSGANASGSNSVALGAGSTAYSDDTVSVGSIDRTRTISNVSDGVNATDVATKGQLDRAMGGMQGQVNDLSRNAYSGIAAATALTMIPGVDPGKTISFGIGGATYKGYQAVAFGGEARITQNLKMKAGVGMSSGGNTVGVGASYQW